MERRTPSEDAQEPVLLAIVSILTPPLPRWLPSRVVSKRRGRDATAELVALLQQAIDVLAEQRERMVAAVARERELVADLETEESKGDWLEVLAEFGRLDYARKEALNDAAPYFGLPAGARLRMLEYLLRHIGEVVNRQSLAGVAGIDDWARRIRELRVEEGWPIASNATRDDLSPGLYILVAGEADRSLREQWQLANSIRNSGGSASDRLLAYFRANVGAVVDKEQLSYVANIKSYARRVRELVEGGWQIDSYFDRPGLHPGEYVMTSEEQLDARAREHIKQRQILLETAGWRCQKCGANPKSDQEVRLQVHHKLPVHRGGGNDDSNLIVLCDACHAGEHATARTAVVDELKSPSRERFYS